MLSLVRTQCQVKAINAFAKFSEGRENGGLIFVFRRARYGATGEMHMLPSKIVWSKTGAGQSHFCIYNGAISVFWRKIDGRPSHQSGSWRQECRVRALQR